MERERQRARERDEGGRETLGMREESLKKDNKRE